MKVMRDLAALVVVLLWAAGCATHGTHVQRYGSVIGVKEDKLDYYKALHAKPWQGVLDNLKACHVHNYSIYLKKMDDGKYYLFSYFEYTGHDFDADMEKMASDETVKKWWKETDPCQFPLENRKQGEWWASMEEVFHSD